jgi:hypothetical protein
MLTSQLIVDNAKAQVDAPGAENVFKANLIAPGLSYEKRIGYRQTLVAEAYLAPYFAFSYSSNFGSDFYFALMPGVEAAYRYYYNGSRRADKGYTTSLNNMNYFSFVYIPTVTDVAISDAYVDETRKRVVHTIGVVWGFQRNYRNRISLDLYIGPGCMIGKSTDINASGQYYSKVGIAPTIVSTITMGLWLNKRRSGVN